MNPILIFRICVVAELFFFVLSIVPTFLPEPNEDWARTIEWSSDGDLVSYFVNTDSPLAGLIWLPLIVPPILLLLTAEVGLLFFWKWARPTFLCMNVFLLFCNLIAGIAITRPTEGLFESLSVLLTGAIITLSYLPPISDRFSDSPELPLRLPTK